MSDTNPSVSVPSSGTLPPLLRQIDRGITLAASTIGVAALASLFLALGADVVVRYVTRQSLGWPSEMPQLLFPWLTMAGVVMAAQQTRHIAVSGAIYILPVMVQRVLMCAIYVLIAVTFFWLTKSGLAVLTIVGGEVYPVTKLTATWAYAALVAGTVALGLGALIRIVAIWRAPDPTFIFSGLE